MYSYIDILWKNHIDESIQFCAVRDYLTVETWTVGFVSYIQQREFF
jgi:hypothetical protein